MSTEERLEIDEVVGISRPATNHIVAVAVVISWQVLRDGGKHE
jgi:hypothetical protein